MCMGFTVGSRAKTRVERSLTLILNTLLAELAIFQRSDASLVTCEPQAMGGGPNGMVVRGESGIVTRCGRTCALGTAWWPCGSMLDQDLGRRLTQLGTEGSMGNRGRSGPQMSQPPSLVKDRRREQGRGGAHVDGDTLPYLRNLTSATNLWRTAWRYIYETWYPYRVALRDSPAVRIRTDTVV